jgi:hypothetical protein
MSLSSFLPSIPFSSLRNCTKSCFSSFQSLSFPLILPAALYLRFLHPLGVADRKTTVHLSNYFFSQWLGRWKWRLKGGQHQQQQRESDSEEYRKRREQKRYKVDDLGSVE